MMLAESEASLAAAADTANELRMQMDTLMRQLDHQHLQDVDEQHDEFEQHHQQQQVMMQEEQQQQLEVLVSTPATSKAQVGSVQLRHSWLR